MDFARETCRAFDAGFYLVATHEHARHSKGSPAPIVVPSYTHCPAPYVLLTSSKTNATIALEDIPEDATIVVGADDGIDPTGIEMRAHIKTPASYYLWSAVAAGIAMHEVGKS